MPLSDVVRRSPAGGALRQAKRAARQAGDRAAEHIDFDRLPSSLAVRLAYQVMLGRDPDPVGFGTYEPPLRSGEITRRSLVESLRGSDEFQSVVRFGPDSLGPSIHAGRCQFVRSLPAARRIVDLGGTHLANPDGAMVGMGYPYPFESLTIIDLPLEERHELYRAGGTREHIDTALGPITYRYHSMTDLSAFADGSVDLVYSGQTIEHITPAEGAKLLEDVHRILRPGGHLGLDTPNARITRLQQAEFIDPDHEVEYRAEELLAMVRDAGLEVVTAAGLNYAGASAAAGRFDAAEAAGNTGLHAEMEDCYILCLVARRPA